MVGYTIVIKKIIPIGSKFTTIWVSDSDNTKYADISDLTVDELDNIVVLTTKLKIREV